MRTKLGLAIKVWTEYLYLTLGPKSPSTLTPEKLSSEACNKLTDALAELDRETHNC